MLITILAVASLVINCIANAPQIYRIYKRKCADDFSTLSYSLIFLNALVFSCLTIIGGSSILVVVNAWVATIWLGIILAQIVYYKNIT